MRDLQNTSPVNSVDSAQLLEENARLRRNLAEQAADRLRDLETASPGEEGFLLKAALDRAHAAEAALAARPAIEVRDDALLRAAHDRAETAEATCSRA